MQLKGIVAPAVALSAVALSFGALPAQGQEKSEPAATADGTPASTVEAAGQRVSRFASERGALGSYYDASRGQHVIVTAPGASLTASEASSATGAATRVEQRAITQARVDAIQARIASRSFDARARDYSYASNLNLQTGRIDLNTDAPPAVTAALVRSFPGEIDVRAGGPSDVSRQSDTAPFWGGASIKSGGGVCTAGFPVKKSSGTRYMLTAGHCFGVGATVLTTGGNLSLGTVVQRGPIPPFDMELIGGKSYGSRIFVGGTNSTTSKPLQGSGDPVVNFVGYCFSGQTSGEKCNQRVVSVTAQVCTQTGCKSPVIKFDHGAGLQGGDSGSPFYIPSTNSSGVAGVHARGISIASGGGFSYAEKWSRISSHLGVSIVLG